MTEHFIAGSIGGLAGLVVGYPLDLIKVRLQSQGSSGGPDRVNGVVSGLRSIVKAGGPKSLFSGMLSPMMASVPCNILLFGAYGHTLKYLARRDQVDERSFPLWHAFVAGGVGGVTAGICTTPCDLAKIRMQNQAGSTPLALHSQVTASRPPPCAPFPASASNILHPNHGGSVLPASPNAFSGHVHQPLQQPRATGFAGSSPSSPPPRAPPGPSSRPSLRSASSVAAVSASGSGPVTPQPAYKGSIDCMRQVFKQGGIRALFKGYTITCTRDFFGQGGYFFFYHCYTRYLQKLLHPPSVVSLPSEAIALSPGITALAAGLAGLSAFTIIHPLDVIKSRVQQSQAKLRIVPCAVQSYRKEGFRVFFNGLGASLTRAFPTQAATFVVFEAIMALFRSYNRVL